MHECRYKAGKKIQNTQHNVRNFRRKDLGEWQVATRQSRQLSRLQRMDLQRERQGGFQCHSCSFPVLLALILEDKNIIQYMVAVKQIFVMI